MSVSEALLLSIMGTCVPYFMKSRQCVGMSKEDTPIVSLLCFLKANRKRHEGVGKQNYLHFM